MVKVKKTTKGKSKKTHNYVFNGVDVNKFSLEELQDYTTKMYSELEKERSERNYLQLERDNVRKIWEIARKNLSEKKTEVDLIGAQKDELQIKHAQEIEAMKQKMKQLLFENKIKLDDENVKRIVALNEMDEEKHQEITQIMNETRNLKCEKAKSQVNFNSTLRELSLEHAKQISELRRNFEKELTSIEDKYRFLNMENVQKMDLARRTALKEVEEKRDRRIKSLIQSHDETIDEMKTQYGEILSKNLSLIDSLKEEIISLKTTNQKLNNRSINLVKENQNLNEVKLEQEEELKKLNKNLSHRNQDRRLVNQYKNLLKEAQNSMKNLENEHELLLNQFETIRNERDTIYEQFVSTINKVKQKNDLQTVVMDEKIKILLEKLEISETCSDQGYLFERQVIVKKNELIRDLNKELKLISGRYNELLVLCQTKQNELGLTDEISRLNPINLGHLPDLEHLEVL